jgi:hypothetical protein
MFATVMQMLYGFAVGDVVRCAILLDELDDYRGLRRPSSLGHVVVEMATPNAIPLLRFSCSSRTMALPTGLMNARRVRAARVIRVLCFAAAGGGGGAVGCHGAAADW